MSHYKYIWLFLILFFTLIIFARRGRKKTHFPYSRTTPKSQLTKRVCLDIDRTLKARHKSCFLRPDTGPCRADIIQWYYDVKQKKCYQFFWGGCQGNGNRFETYNECHNYCQLNDSAREWVIPHFCSLSFDYGNCFGYFHRWAWNSLTKNCRRHLYSGCGGNQNNFQTQEECRATCMTPPNNTLYRSHMFTTCIPINAHELN